MKEFLGFAREFVPFALRLLRDPFEGALVDLIALLGKLPALHKGSLVAVDRLEVTVEQVGACLQGQPMGSVKARYFAERFRVGEQFELSRFEFEPSVRQQDGNDLGDRPRLLHFLEGHVEVDATAVTTGDGDGFDQT